MFEMVANILYIYTSSPDLTIDEKLMYICRRSHFSLKGHISSCMTKQDKAQGSILKNFGHKSKFINSFVHLFIPIFCVKR